MRLCKLIGVMTLFLALNAFGDCQTECSPCKANTSHDPICDECGCEQTWCDSCESNCCCSCCCEPCDFIPPCPPEACAYNAPEIIDIKCSWDVFATLSFVYFQAKEENLDFIESVTSTPSGGSASLSHVGCFGEMSFDFDPGFKLGIGFNTGCDNWGFYAEYFRYHNDVGNGSFSDSVLASDNADYEACLYWSRTVNGVSPDSFSAMAEDMTINASSKWHLEMDIADFNVNRRYFVGRCLTFEPHFGLRTAWITQSYTVKYSQETGGSTPTQESIVSKNTSCSWAVGGRAGLNTDWKFCGGFFFFGKAALSILYTDYDDIKSEQTRTLTGTSSSQDSYASPTREICFLRPQADIGLGLGWSDYFCCNDWFLDFRIGYEFQTYWNQNVLPGFNNCTQDPTAFYGDLYLQGLVLTARLDF